MGYSSGDAYRDNDWFADRSWDLFARQALLEHGELPIRSHVIGGGVKTLGHPFDSSLSPSFLPTLLFGDVIGVKVLLAGLLLLGTWGMFGLARRWLELEELPAAMVAMGFALSGWFPSMMIVGFYAQAFYLLVPAILYLFWFEERPVLRTLLVGMLGYVLLAQTGNALLAISWFCALATWLREAARGGLPGLLIGVLTVILLSVPLAFLGLVDIPWLLPAGWGSAALLFALFRPGRRLARGLSVWAGRAALVFVVTASLGCAKIVALTELLETGDYDHAMSSGWELWFPDGDKPGVEGEEARIFRWPDAEQSSGVGVDPDFYGSIADLFEGLLKPAPIEGLYEPFYSDDDGVPMEERGYGLALREYEWLGLSPTILALAVLGLLTGVGFRVLLSSLFLLCAGVVLGPHVAPDLYFLLMSGLPGFERVVQPIKYLNFFMLPVLSLAAGLGFRRLPLPSGRPSWIAAGVVLVVPFFLNGPVLADRFSEPRAEIPRAESFHQVAQIGHPDWATYSPERIEELREVYLLRELARPPVARAYDQSRAGVGVVDWYGTLRTEEQSIPKLFVTPEGNVVPNPAYPGAEAWVKEGDAEIQEIAIRPTSIRIKVLSRGPHLIVINQGYDPDFKVRPPRRASGEPYALTVGEEDGLLLLTVLEEGAHDIRLDYAPQKTRLSLLVSLLALAGWGLGLRWALRSEGREPEKSVDASSSPEETDANRASEQLVEVEPEAAAGGADDGGVPAGGEGESLDASAELEAPANPE